MKLSDIRVGDSLYYTNELFSYIPNKYDLKRLENLFKENLESRTLSSWDITKITRDGEVIWEREG